MPPPAVTLPFWFQILLGVVAILSFLGGAWFALFVIWPSIRRSNRMSDWVEREGGALLESLKEKTILTGSASSHQEFRSKSTDQGDL